MGELSARNFGLLIAYVLPGFVALAGLSLRCDAARLWLFGPDGTGPSAGSIPCTLIASVAAGMTASAVRWAVVDTLHHATGVARPAWNDARLTDRLPAYELLIEIHYRYYQFYANSLVGGLFAYGLWRSHAAERSGPSWPDAAAVFLVLVFYAGSRDTLRKYYSRTALLLGVVGREVAHDQRRTAQRTQASSKPGPEDTGEAFTCAGDVGGGWTRSGDGEAGGQACLSSPMCKSDHAHE